MLYTPPEYLIWKLSQLAFNISLLKNHFREQSFSENFSKLLPRDFDTWNTCYTQLSKPSPKLRSWAPLLVYDATVTLTNIPLIPITKKNWGWINWEWFLKKFLCLFNWIDWWWFHFRWRIPVTHPRSGKGSKRGTLWRMKTNKMVFMR